MKIIALTGADASGKDTQISKLEKWLSGQNYKSQTISIWDSLRSFSQVAEPRILQLILNQFLTTFKPEARSYFLLACLRNSLARIDRSCDFVILNGYYFKYWASELVYGSDNRIWQTAYDLEMVKPDIIFYLNTPAEVCLKRRTTWSNYESGHQNNLYEFQKNMHQVLSEIMADQKQSVTLDGSQNSDAIFEELLSHLPTEMGAQI